MRWIISEVLNDMRTKGGGGAELGNGVKMSCSETGNWDIFQTWKQKINYITKVLRACYISPL